MPSHTSVDGKTWPIHAPQAPPEQTCVPGLQEPTPEVPAGPL